MATFTKMSEAEVSSSDGYSVKTSYHRVTYREFGKALLIESEHEVEPFKLVIYRSTIQKWCRPYNDEPITDFERDRIVDRVSAALNFLRVPHVFE